MRRTMEIFFAASIPLALLVLVVSIWPPFLGSKKGIFNIVLEKTGMCNTVVCYRAIETTCGLTLWMCDNGAKEIRCATNVVEGEK